MSPFGDPQEHKEKLAAGTALAIDVREDFEVEAGHIKGAFWLPLSKIQEDPEGSISKLKELAEQKELLFYCRSGNRSGMVNDLMAQHGVTGQNIGGFDELAMTLESTTGLPE